jgi:hypothetical protein
MSKTQAQATAEAGNATMLDSLLDENATLTRVGALEPGDTFAVRVAGQDPRYWLTVDRTEKAAGGRVRIFVVDRDERGRKIGSREHAETLHGNGKVPVADRKEAAAYFRKLERAASRADKIGNAPKPAPAAKASNKTADGKRQRTSPAMKLALAKLSNAEGCSLTRAEFGHVDPMILIGLDKRGWATLERAEGNDRQADLSTLTDAGKVAIRELLNLTAA